MVHFTCDLCGKDLTASGDPRYVVKIEAYAGFDPTEITEDDLDDDHMEAVSQILQRDEGLSSEELDGPGPQGVPLRPLPRLPRQVPQGPAGQGIPPLVRLQQELTQRPPQANRTKSADGPAKARRAGLLR